MSQDENPHIYVRKCVQRSSDGSNNAVVVITDTGCGTRKPNRLASSPQEWNVKSFIEHSLELTGEIFYLIILSHCHYDHILGLPQFLNPAHDETSAVTTSHVSIVSSGYDKGFTTPYENLSQHSLCKDMQIPAPHYKTTIWAHGLDRIQYLHPQGRMELPIVTLHTPGHTPDSLTWYDTEHRRLYVGDSFLKRKWNEEIGNKGPASILHVNDSDVYDWWFSTKKLLSFVQSRNWEAGEKVKLSAGHVTKNVDAEKLIIAVLEGMVKVFRNEADFEDRGMKRGEKFGFWACNRGKFTMEAPVRVVEEGRARVPRREWALGGGQPLFV